MHELGITQKLLDVALGEATRHGARRIRAIRLVVGEHAGIAPDALSFCFEVVSQGTIAEGAALKIERAGSAARCEVCEAMWTLTDSSIFCPSCGASVTPTAESQGIRVDSLEVE